VSIIATFALHQLYSDYVHTTHGVHLEPLLVEAIPLNTTAIEVNWMISPFVESQGFQSLVVDVRSECYTGVLVTLPQTFTITHSERNELTVGSLGMQ